MPSTLSGGTVKIPPEEHQLIWKSSLYTHFFLLSVTGLAIMFEPRSEARRVKSAVTVTVLRDASAPDIVDCQIRFLLQA